MLYFLVFFNDKPLKTRFFVVGVFRDRKKSVMVENKYYHEKYAEKSVFFNDWILWEL